MESICGNLLGDKTIHQALLLKSKSNFGNKAIKHVLKGFLQP